MVEQKVTDHPFEDADLPWWPRCAHITMADGFGWACDRPAAEHETAPAPVSPANDTGAGA
jgi:hypothetical protein